MIFSAFWKTLHIIGILFILGVKLFGEEEEYAFGFGIGISAPIDIHVPTSEDWKHLVDPDGTYMPDTSEPTLATNYSTEVE